MSVAHLMTQTLSQYRGEQVEDSGGGQELTFSFVGSVRAKVNQPTPEEVQEAAVWGAQLSHVVHTEAYEDIRRGDIDAGNLDERRHRGVLESRQEFQRGAHLR